MAEYLVAIQLITLCQAMDLRGIDKFSDIAKELLSIVRNIVPFISNDRELDEDIENLVDLISGDSITVLLSKYSDSTW
ncbi:Histidine ammonia-lyase [subsurface metagenome]